MKSRGRQRQTAAERSEMDDATMPGNFKVYIFLFETCCLATFALTESQMRSCGNSGAKQVRSGLKVHAAV